MLRLRSLALLAIAGPLLAGPTPTETRVRFSVAEGTTLTKRFSSRVDLALDEMRVLRNGKEPDGLPELEMQVETDFEVVVEDRYVAVRDGRTRELVRRFDTISVDTTMSMEMDMQGQTQNQETPVKAGSELEGETVRFLWNEESETYEPSFVDSEADEDLLEDLALDMDLRALLPGHDVAIDESWEVDPRALPTVMAPGGDLKLVAETPGHGMGDMSGQMGELSDWFDENLRGEVRCRLVEVVRQGERDIAVVAITLELENDVDLTELAQEELAKVDLPPGSSEIEVEHMRTNLAIEGEGRLEWDLAGGHFHSFALNGDFRMKMDLGVGIELTGFGEVSTQQEFDMSGTLTFSAEIQ